MIPKPAIKNLLMAFNLGLGGLIAVGVGRAGAQTSPSPQTTLQNPPSDCKTKTPQAETFMTEISAIIEHGDLTDIPFAEKTLRTKFTEEPAKTYNGQPDPLRIFFQTDQIYGNPIYADLSLSRSKTSLSKNQFYAYILIYDQHFAGMKTTFMEDCIDISARNFSSHFGGDFVHVPANDDPSPYTTQYRQQEFPGKNNTMLKLSIATDYMRPDNPVVGIGIYEIAKSADSGS